MGHYCLGPASTGGTLPASTGGTVPVLHRVRGSLGDFENYTRGVGSSIMTRMGWQFGGGSGKL